ncbi:type II toxin-antitoxin system Phd/YefM family antitoxin [candidate division KSB1 bacterium]|nr:type II toxin-antitoxin system Phd/YefM family antitoxin [candidate division KSB1 bacterium]
MNTQTVTVEDAQTRLAELLNLAQAGNEIIIAQGDQPVARLVAIAETKPKRRVAGLHRGKIWMSDDFDAPLPDEYWLSKKRGSHQPHDNNSNLLKRS